MKVICSLSLALMLGIVSNFSATAKEAANPNANASDYKPYGIDRPEVSDQRPQWWKALRAIGLAKDIQVRDWILGQSELIKIDLHDPINEYYLLVLPFNLLPIALDSNYAGFDVELGLNAPSVQYPPDLDQKAADAQHLRVESIYPSHTYIGKLFTHSNELDLSASPQAFGFSAVNVTDKLSNSDQVLASLPTLTGTFDTSALRLSWDLTRQGRAPITVGSVTLYGILSRPHSPDKLRVYLRPYQFTDPSPDAQPTFTTTLSPKIQNYVENCGRSLDTYLALHKSELPSDAVGFLTGLLPKDGQPKSGPQTYTVTIQPVQSPAPSLKAPDAPTAPHVP